MPDIRDILQLKPIDTEICGYQVRILRPTLADLVDAIRVNQADPVEAKCWMLVRHLRTRDGEQVFPDIASASLAPARFAAECVAEIERLYNEGSD